MVKYACGKKLRQWRVVGEVMELLRLWSISEVSVKNHKTKSQIIIKTWFVECMKTTWTFYSLNKNKNKKTKKVYTPLLKWLF